MNRSVQVRLKGNTVRKRRYSGKQLNAVAIEEAGKSKEGVGKRPLLKNKNNRGLEWSLVGCAAIGKYAAGPVGKVRVQPFYKWYGNAGRDELKIIKKGREIIRSVVMDVLLWMASVFALTWLSEGSESGLVIRAGDTKQMRHIHQG